MMKKITLFEIRLDESILVLRGEPSEAPGVQLSGKIVISCTEPVNIKSLSIKVTALQRFRVNEVFNGPWGPTLKLFKGDNVLWSDRKVPIGEKSVIPAGNHEYPFQWVLSGSAPESVEGFSEASILWDLHAHLERSVYLSDSHAHKHFRVIRTLPHTALEFSQMMSVENIWPDKVVYSINTPSKAVVFGSYIPIQLRLTPLLKGLEVSRITIGLKEAYELTPGAKEISSTRHILEAEFPGFEGPPSEDDDGAWVLQEKLYLPQTLAKCLQDCDVGKIKIRHKLRFAIQLKNPDGHVSELRATLPIMLFISQHYLVNEQNEVPQATNQVTSESELSAPPRYEQHQLDQLFDGVDLDMYLSRTNSPILLSRSGSAENLQVQSSLTPLSSMSGASSPMFTHDISTSRSSGVSSGSVSGVPSLLTAHGHADLVARLQRAHQRPVGSSGSLNALANSTSWTNPSSGRESPTPESSNDTGASVSLSSSPNAALYMTTMCKVPSYSTAISTPTRNLSFETSPTYERVASNPPSRVTSSQSLVEMADSPALSRSSSSSGQSTSGQRPTSPKSQPSSQSTETSRTRRPSQGSSSKAPRLFSGRWRG